jgi:hypothetical protein
LTQEELTRQIESSFQYAAPGEFKNIKEALQVVGSALRYLTNQCEDMATIEAPEVEERDGLPSKDTD